MSFPRWLGLSFAAAIAAAFGACTTVSEPMGTTSGQTTATGSGGSGGDTTIITTITIPMEAGPLTCKGMSSNVPKGDCDALSQDCPPGQSCRPAQVGSSWKTQCVASNGLKTAGEVCYEPSECADGLFCILDKCTPICCRDDNQPCSGGICNVSAKYGTYNVYFCHYAPTCDLLTPNACAEGLACHIEDVAQGLATCAEPSGVPSPDLGACEFINDCPDMEQCHLATNTCRFYCWMDATQGTAPGLGGCPEGQSCKAKYGNTKLDFGVPGLGLCFLDAVKPDAGSDAGDDGGSGGSGGTGGTSGTTGAGGMGTGGAGTGAGGTGAADAGSGAASPGDAGSGAADAGSGAGSPGDAGSGAADAGPKPDGG